MDKRIRELNTDSALPLNWRLPFDYPGLLQAEYRTLQQVLDIINLNLNLPQSYTGSTNPDNALGTDGSTYYKYVAGQTFGIWFKSIGAWTQFLEIDLSIETEISLSAAEMTSFSGTKSGMDLNIAAGTIIITNYADLITKHGYAPDITFTTGNYTGTKLQGLFDDQDDPTTLTIETGSTSDSIIKLI